MEHTTDDCQCEGKKCTKCGEVRCIGQYTKQKRGKGGLKAKCKVCDHADNKLWRENNKEYNQERQRAYFHTDAGRECQRKSDQRPERKERKRELRYEKGAEKRKARLLLRDERRAQRKPINRAKRHEKYLRDKERHKEEINERWRCYYHKNKEYMHDRIMKWRKEHPGAHAAIQAKRKTNKTRAGGSYTVEEWEALKAQYNYKCLRCGKQEPDIKLTADHVVPICKNGTSNIDNIQPLCKPCNCSKHDKIIDFRPKNT